MKCRQLLLAVLLAPVLVLADKDVKVPEGIRYKPASDQVNERASEVLRKHFNKEAGDDAVSAMFESLVICGPGLWADVKSDEKLSKLEQGRVTFAVPVLGKEGQVIRTDKLEGKALQSREEVLLLWKAFAGRMDFGDVQIRKLNADELKIFWAMISFDITEPLFIVQSKEHKILVAFTSPDQLKIAWIDDCQRLDQGN